MQIRIVNGRYALFHVYPNHDDGSTIDQKAVYIKNVLEQHANMLLSKPEVRREAP